MATTEDRITAALHDVVEDCGLSLAGLWAEGFCEMVIEAIDAVTKRPKKSCKAFTP